MKRWNIDKGKDMKKKALILTILGFILFSGVLNAEQRMKMSTTTSTDNSGLLEVLIPPFEKKFDINWVKSIQWFYSLY